MIVPLVGVVPDGTTPVSATPEQQPFSVSQGVDVTIQLTATGSNGTAINLSTWSGFRLTIRRASIGAPIVATLTGGAPQSSGQPAVFALPGSLTATLAFGGYLYDVFGIDSNGQHQQPVPNSWIQVNLAAGATFT
jgi:hypothetical protein